jgi:hypothetical protein
VEPFEGLCSTSIEPCNTVADAALAHIHTHTHTHLMKSAISRRSLPAFVFPEGSTGTPRQTHTVTAHNVTPTLNSTRQSSVNCGIGASEPGCLRPRTKHANASLHLQEPIHTRTSGRAHTHLHTNTFLPMPYAMAWKRQLPSPGCRTTFADRSLKFPPPLPITQRITQHQMP